MPSDTAWQRLMPGICALALCLGLAIYVVSGGETRIVQFVPDDAFYYLVGGRHHALSGLYSFDGTTPMSGFHPLFMSLVCLLYTIWPNAGINSVFFSLAVLGGVAVSTSVLLLDRLMVRRYGDRARLATWFAIGSPALLTISGNLMESPYVILSTACLLSATLGVREGDSRSRPPPPSRARLLAALLAGIFGSLSRSDFGLIPAAVLGAVLVVRWRGAATPLLPAAAGLFGAAIGLGAVMLQSHSISGEWLQASALVKAHWGQIQGYSLRRPLMLLTAVAAPVSIIPGYHSMIKTLAFMVSLALAAGVVVLIWRNPPADRRPDAAVLAAAAILVGYVVFDGLNSGALYAWYTVHFILPVCILVGVAAATISGRHARLWRTAVAVVGVSGLPFAFIPAYPTQDTLRQAGFYLRDHPELAPAGSFNGGILSYFSGGRVVNLDGLVNDEVVPYVISGRLSDYVVRRRLASVMDHAVMFTDPVLRRRGGHDTASFDALLGVPEPIPVTEMPDLPTVGMRFYRPQLP